MLSHKRHLTVISAMLSIPLLMGQGCPEFGGTVAGDTEDSIALLKVTVAAISTTPAATILSFNPVEAGKVVTMSIKANATGSRPEVNIFDNLNNLVAAEPAPTTQQVVVTFTSSTTGSHRILLRELGAPASLYEVLVVQQP